jgi:hypothetical protein
VIPRILHQTWKDAEVPERWRALAAGWRARHPDWAYRLWTDADLRRLVADHYPELLSTFEAYDHEICRVDTARYLLLHRHGGVYVDLDFECLRPIGPLLEGHRLVLGEEPASHLELTIVRRHLSPPRRIVCNAFAASAPGHPFWMHLAQELRSHAGADDPLDATGPFRLTAAVEGWEGPDPVRVEPATRLYPLDKHEVADGALDRPDTRGRLAREAYAVHHWAGSWIPGFQARARRLRAARAPIGRADAGDRP